MGTVLPKSGAAGRFEKTLFRSLWRRSFFEFSPGTGIPQLHYPVIAMEECNIVVYSFGARRTPDCERQPCASGQATTPGSDGAGHVAPTAWRGPPAALVRLRWGQELAPSASQRWPLVLPLAVAGRQPAVTAVLVSLAHN